MEHMFLLFLLVSGSLCTGNNSYPGTGTSLAVCQPDTCALLSEVAAMREKLAATAQAQSTLEQNLSTMMQKMATVEANLQFYKSQAEELQRVNKAQDEQLKALKDATSVSKSKLAFSAALEGRADPFEPDTTLKYQKIFSNIGNRYNPNTGIFTAMVRGVYYFRYIMFSNNQPDTVASLMMNSRRLASTSETVGKNNHDSATNAAVVQLDAGDSVFVRLHANREAYDNVFYYNTFSGFLLFTL